MPTLVMVCVAATLTSACNTTSTSTTTASTTLTPSQTPESTPKADQLTPTSPSTPQLEALESSLVSERALSRINGREFVFAEPDEYTGEVKQSFVAVLGDSEYTRFASGEEGYPDEDPKCGPVQLFKGDWEPTTWRTTSPLAVARKLAVKTGEGKGSRGALGEWKSTAVLMDSGQPEEFIDSAFTNLKPCLKRFDFASISLDLSGSALISISWLFGGSITVVEPIGDILYVVEVKGDYDSDIEELFDPFAAAYNRLANEMADAQGLMRKDIDFNDRKSVEYFAVRPSPEPERGDDGTVIYEVLDSGSQEVVVSYGTATGSEQVVLAPPWRREINDFKQGAILTLVVSSLDEAGAGCRITVGGRVVAENMSRGSYTTATCRARR